MPRAVTFEVDYRQPRPSVNAQCSFVQGSEESGSGLKSKDGWSAKYGSGCWVSPICKTLMLLPGPVDPTWTTSNTGIYAKLAKSDFTFTTSSKWEDVQDSGTADTRIQGRGDTTAEKAISNSAWGLNRGFYFSWYIYNTGDQDIEIGRVGLGVDTSNTDDSLWLVLRSTNVVEVHYGTGFLQVGSIEGKDPAQVSPSKTVNPFGKADVMVIPYRGRDVLIYSPTRGGGFVVRLPEEVVPLRESSPTVIRSTDYLWWKIVAGQANVQVARVMFGSSGYVLSQYREWLYDPGTTSYSTKVLQDQTSLAGGSVAVSLRLADDSGDWTVETQGYRVKAALTGSGSGSTTKSPFIYVGGVLFEDEQIYTDDSQQFTLDKYIMSATLEVPDSHECSELRLTLDLPEEIELDMDRLRSIGGRAIRVRVTGGDFGDFVLWEGVTEPPEWSDTFNDEARRVNIRAKSLWSIIERYCFESDYPLAGLTLDDAMVAIWNKCGIPSEYITASTSTYVLDQDNITASDSGFQVNYHEYGADASNRLVDSYAGTWHIRELPYSDHVLLQFLSPDDMAMESPLVTVYDTTSARDAAMTLADEDKHKYLIQSYSEKIVPPEANDITVVGMDPKTYRPIIGHYADELSQDATAPPTAWPANYLGRKAILDFRHEMITDQDGVTLCLETMKDRTTNVRRICEFEAEMVEIDDGSPLWKSDPLTIEKADGQGGPARIVSLSINFELEPESSYPLSWRNTRYCAEYLENGNVGAPTRTAGTRVSELAKEYNMRELRRMGYKSIKTLIGSPLAVVRLP